MKSLYLLPLLFLSACSTTPKVSLRPQPSPALATETVRYPEIVRAYHFGRYVDPSSGSVMHEQHTVFRIEENARWDLHPGANENVLMPMPRDAAFNPLPVSDAMLAEVNAQKLATSQIMTQSRALSSALGQFQSALSETKTNLQETAALRAAISDMKHRLDALETAPEQFSSQPISATNAPIDPLSP